MKLLPAFLALATVDAQFIPGLNLLPVSIIGPIVTQIKNTALSTLVPLIGETLPIQGADGNPISTSDFISNFPDNAIVTLLASEKTGDPSLWDADFIASVLDDTIVPVNTVNQLVGYVEVAQELVSPEFIDAVGISGMQDITGANILNLIEELESFSPEVGAALDALSGGNADAFKSQISTVVDQVDFADPFWQDPSAWTAENISIQMGPLTELGLPVDIINQISAGMVQLESTGLLDNASGGFDFSDLTSTFDPCIDVLNTAKKMIAIPSLSDIMTFDMTELLINLLSLTNDGANCYATYSQYIGNEVPVLEYVSYATMGVEKVLKFIDDLPEVKRHYQDMMYSSSARFEIIQRYKEISYTKYTIKALESVQFIITHEVADFFYETADFYNMLIDDVPVISEYIIRSYDIEKMISQADDLFELAQVELKSLEIIAGPFIDGLISQRIQG